FSRDWSSDVCSSDLVSALFGRGAQTDRRNVGGPGRFSHSIRSRITDPRVVAFPCATRGGGDLWRDAAYWRLGVLGCRIAVSCLRDSSSGDTRLADKLARRVCDRTAVFWRCYRACLDVSVLASAT